MFILGLYTSTNINCNEQETLGDKWKEEVRGSNNKLGLGLRAGKKLKEKHFKRK